MNITGLFLYSLTFWYWFGFAALLLIFELLLANTGFLLWVAASAILTGLLCFIVPTLTVPYQLILFITVALFSTLLSRKYLKYHPIKTITPLLNKPNLNYIGRQFTLELPIENGRGIIRIGDSIWKISGPDLPAGTIIKIIGAEGTILQVVPLIIN